MEVIKPVHVNDENAKRAERIHASFFNIFQDKLEELQRYISDDNNKKKLTTSDLKDILSTWKDTKLKPKIHFSSPKSRKDKRSHHNYIDEKECENPDYVWMKKNITI